MSEVDIKKLRKSLDLSQDAFAKKFGFNLGTLRHWEQGNRHPDRAASILLAIVTKFPDIVLTIASEMDFSSWKNGGKSTDTASTR